MKCFDFHHVPKALLSAQKFTNAFNDSTNALRYDSRSFHILTGLWTLRVLPLFGTRLHVKYDNKEWRTDKAVQNDRLSDFAKNLNNSLPIQLPINRLIVNYHSNKVPISDVLPDFHRLQNEFASCTKCSSPLPKCTIIFLLSSLQGPVPIHI